MQLIQALRVSCFCKNVVVNDDTSRGNHQLTSIHSMTFFEQKFYVLR